MEASINLPDDGDHDGVIQLLLKPTTGTAWQEIVIPEHVENLYAVIVAGGMTLGYEGGEGGTKRAIFLRPKDMQLARLFVRVGLGMRVGGSSEACVTEIQVVTAKIADAIPTDNRLRELYLYAGSISTLPVKVSVNSNLAYVDGYADGGYNAAYVGGGGGKNIAGRLAGGYSNYSAGGGGSQGVAGQANGYAGGVSGALPPTTLAGQAGQDGDILNTCGCGGHGGAYGSGVVSGAGGKGGFPGGGAGAYGDSSLGYGNYGADGVGGDGCALIYMW